MPDFRGARQHPSFHRTQEMSAPASSRPPHAPSSPPARPSCGPWLTPVPASPRSLRYAPGTSTSTPAPFASGPASAAPSTGATSRSRRSCSVPSSSSIRSDRRAAAARRSRSGRFSAPPAHCRNHGQHPASPARRPAPRASAMPTASPASRCRRSQPPSATPASPQPRSTPPPRTSRHGNFWRGCGPRSRIRPDPTSEGLRRGPWPALRHGKLPRHASYTPSCNPKRNNTCRIPAPAVNVFSRTALQRHRPAGSDTGRSHAGISPPKIFASGSSGPPVAPANQIHRSAGAPRPLSLSLRPFLAPRAHGALRPHPRFPLHYISAVRQPPRVPGRSHQPFATRRPPGPLRPSHLRPQRPDERDKRWPKTPDTLITC